MNDKLEFSFSLEQQEDYAFLIRFGDDFEPLLADEPPPLGKGAGPNPVRLLAAGVASCLSASLLFSLRKFKNKPGRLVASVTGQLTRNDQGRLRIGSINVVIQIDSPADMLEHVDRVIAQFEDFCVVTQSVREGIPVEVSVRDSSGAVLK